MYFSQLESLTASPNLMLSKHVFASHAAWAYLLCKRFQSGAPLGSIIRFYDHIINLNL